MCPYDSQIVTAINMHKIQQTIKWTVYALLIINFESVQRFSSEGINMCLQAKSTLDANNGELKLCGLLPQLREAFAALNLDGNVFQIHDDIEAALNSCRP